jgi:hypothetical protein
MRDIIIVRILLNSESSQLFYSLLILRENCGFTHNIISKSFIFSFTLFFFSQIYFLTQKSGIQFTKHSEIMSLSVSSFPDKKTDLESIQPEDFVLLTEYLT